MGRAKFKRFQIRPQDGRPLEIWFDAKTGLLDRAIIYQATGRLIHLYSDWRPVNAVLVPFEQVNDYADVGEREALHLEQVRVAVHRTSSLAHIPTQPADHFISGGAGSTTVPFEYDGNIVIVQVKIGDAGPFPFVLDTGGHLHLTSETAAALGQSNTGLSVTTSPAGEIVNGVTTVPKLSIGEAVLVQQHAAVIPLKQLGIDRRPKPEIAGVLGLELFTRFLVSVDQRRRTLTLTRLNQARQAASSGIPLPIVFSQDVPLTPGAIAGASGWLVVDSGNSGSTIVQNRWAARNHLTERLSHGVAGRAQAVGGTLEQVISRADVRIGTFDFPREVVSSLPGRLPRAGDDPEEAAIIGQRILSHFNQTWDYARGLVWLERLADVPNLPFNRSGLGLIKEENGDFKVALVIVGSPADAAGIRTGDILRDVNGRTAEKLSRSDVSAIFTQPVGTPVAVRVCGRSPNQCRDIELKLQEVLP